jgi:hypothetical protein
MRKARKVVPQKKQTIARAIYARICVFILILIIKQALLLVVVNNINRCLLSLMSKKGFYFKNIACIKIQCSFKAPYEGVTISSIVKRNYLN